MILYNCKKGEMEMKSEIVKFICPNCGAQWTERQDLSDDWFRLGTT